MLSFNRFKHGLWRQIAPNFGILCLFLVFFGNFADAMELVVWQPHKPGPKIILGVKNDETPRQAAERYEQNLRNNAELAELLVRQNFPALPKENFTPLSKDDFHSRYLMITNMPEDLLASKERITSILEPFAKEGATGYLLPLAADIGLNKVESELFIEMLDNEFMSMMSIGGDDVHRGARGRNEQNLMSYFTNLVRDTFEVRLIKRKAMTIGARLVGRKDRLLGICRGAQIIAFALGYGLGNDIDQEIGGGIKHGRGSGTGEGGSGDIHPEHKVSVLKTASNLFHRIAGQVSEFLSNSYHHQWMIIQRQAGVLLPLEISGISPEDKVTEVAEFEDKVLLTQMHIELMRTRGQGEMKQMGELMMKNLARWFVPGIRCEELAQ